MDFLLITDREALSVEGFRTACRDENWFFYDTADFDDAMMFLRKNDNYAVVVVSHTEYKDTIRLIRYLRRTENKTPIVVLDVPTAAIRTQMYEQGASIVCPPTTFPEERAAIYVASSTVRPFSTFSVGPIDINRNRKDVEVHGVPIHLTTKEYGILELLMLRAGHVITKEMLLSHLYGGIDEPQLKIIDVFMCKIRRKFQKSFGIDPIQTVWGRGYQLKSAKEMLEETVVGGPQTEAVAHFAKSGA